MLLRVVEGLSDYARVATAVGPFAVAVVVRCFCGRNRVTTILLSATTVWFAVNVLMTPFSVAMQEDLVRLRVAFH